MNITRSIIFYQQQYNNSQPKQPIIAYSSGMNQLLKQGQQIPKLAKTKQLQNPYQSTTTASSQLSRIFLLNNRKKVTFTQQSESQQEIYYNYDQNAKKTINTVSRMITFQDHNVLDSENNSQNQGYGVQAQTIHSPQIQNKNNLYSTPNFSYKKQNQQHSDKKPQLISDAKHKKQQEYQQTDTIKNRPKDNIESINYTSMNKQHMKPYTGQQTIKTIKQTTQIVYSNPQKQYKQTSTYYKTTEQISHPSVLAPPVLDPIPSPTSIPTPTSFPSQNQENYQASKWKIKDSVNNRPIGGKKGNADEEIADQADTDHLLSQSSLSCNKSIAFSHNIKPSLHTASKVVEIQMQQSMNDMSNNGRGSLIDKIKMQTFYQSKVIDNPASKEPNITIKQPQQHSTPMQAFNKKRRTKIFSTLQKPPQYLYPQQHISAHKNSQPSLNTNLNPGKHSPRAPSDFHIQTQGQKLTPKTPSPDKKQPRSSYSYNYNYNHNYNQQSSPKYQHQHQHQHSHRRNNSSYINRDYQQYQYDDRYDYQIRSRQDGYGYVYPNQNNNRGNNGYAICPHTQCILKSLNIIDKLTDYPWADRRHQGTGNLGVQYESMQLNTRVNKYISQLTLRDMLEQQTTTKTKRLKQQLDHLTQKFESLPSCSSPSLPLLQQTTLSLHYIQLIQQRYRMWKLRLSHLQQKLKDLLQLDRDKQTKKLLEIVHLREEMEEMGRFYYGDAIGVIREYNAFVDKQVRDIGRTIDIVKTDILGV